MISSRTPEGLPSRCPLCGAETSVEFSDPGDDAPCPSCGCLLWLSASLLERLQDRLAKSFGISPTEVVADMKLTELGADSLDVVEVIMELEEEFDFSIPDEEAEKIHTIGDLIRYLRARQGE